MNNYATFLETIMREAGDIVMSHRSLGEAITTKEKNEIVTPADIASNDFLVRKLQEAYPDIPIYTEESETDRSEAATRWIVDPIDGTTPWVWGNSGFAISIALERNEEVVVGAVYDPVMKEFFYAQQGEAATRNGQKIRPTIGVETKDMLMVVDWGNKADKRREGLAYFQRFFLPEMYAKRIVPQFAPALGLCRIAEGRIQALVCNDTWVEDHAAGAFILRQAGGYRSNFYHHESFKAREAGIIATNEQTTHAAIVEFLEGIN